MSELAIPHSADDMTASWFSGVFGTPVELQRLERIAEGVGLLSELYRATLAGDGVPDTVVAKISTPLVESRGQATAFGMYEREVRFFQHFGESSPVRTPVVYHADWSPETEDSIVVMEDLAALTPGDQAVGLSVDQMSASLDELASLHSAWWGHPGLADLTWAPTFADPIYTETIPGGFEQLSPVLLTNFGHLLSPQVTTFIERLDKADINAIQQHLSKEPLTLLHGDFRGENVMFGTGPDSARAVVLDWQGVVRARGAQELGYFIAQSMPIDERRTNERALIESYLAGLAGGGVEGYEFDELWNDYHYSIALGMVYTAMMAGLDLTHEPTVAKLEIIISRLAVAADDIDVLGLLDTLR
jgi:thiamine kinase-like enzyme